MAHELWKDVPLPMLKYFDESAFVVYLTFLVIFCNTLNGFGFAIYKFCFDNFINEKEMINPCKIEKKLHEE